jgi:hypothetical protein
METHGRLHFSAIMGGGKPLQAHPGHFLLHEEENRKLTGNGRFDPEKYGMMICTECRGSGKFANGLKEMGVCRACGGFGLTKRQ